MSPQTIRDGLCPQTVRVGNPASRISAADRHGRFSRGYGQVVPDKNKAFLLLMSGQFTGVVLAFSTKVLNAERMLRILLRGCSSITFVLAHTRHYIHPIRMNIMFTPSGGSSSSPALFLEGDFACCGKRPRALPWTRSRGAPLENPNPWQHQEPVFDAVGVQICAGGYPSD